jgi:polar amino acid transport system substrate-binding protein
MMAGHIFNMVFIGTGLAAGAIYACNGTITPDISPINNPDFHGVAIFLPEILENADSGPFPDLLKTVNKYYPEGKISISIEPVKRVYLDINNKHADFRFPIMEVSAGADNFTPYQFSKEMLGKVSFVLYSLKTKPLYKQDIINAAYLSKYTIEAHPANWGFSTNSVINLEQSLKKLNAGRIDAVLWAQEESDYIIKKFKLNQIHRAHFDDYPDLLFFSCNQRGDFVNTALSKAISAARASGELQKAYIKVHKPYQDWQP